MKKNKIIDPSDKADSLTELVKAHMQRFDNTRKIQWTFNGLFWSGIILTAPFLKSIKFDPHDGNKFFWYSFIVFLAYAAVIFLFQRTLDWDKNKSKHYRQTLEKMIDVNEEKGERLNWSIVWLITQLIVTGLLLFGVFQILR